MASGDPKKHRHEHAQGDAGHRHEHGAGAHKHDHPAHDHGHAHDANHAQREHAGHALSHAGHHHHGPPGYVQMERALAIGISLNLLFVLIELYAAFKSGSLALDSDAAHNFGDLISLVFAWGATVLARRTPSPSFTYGLRGGTILASLANGLLLLVASVGIGYAAVIRVTAPAPVDGMIVVVVAAVGVVINGVSAMFLARHRHHDLNARGAFIHLVGDAAISGAVIVSGFLVKATGLFVIDSAMSLAIAVLMFVSTIRLVAESLRLVLQGVPTSIDSGRVERFLLEQPGVIATHDLHIWAMSTAENAMTVHLVMPDGHPGDVFLADVTRELDLRFHLGHATLQVETGPGCGACSLGLRLA